MPLSEQEEFELLSLERERAGVDAQKKTPMEMRQEPSIMDVGKALIQRNPYVQAYRKISDVAEKIPYEAGKELTDISAGAGLPPEVAGGLGYGMNVALQAVPALMGAGPEKGAIALKDVVKAGTLKEAEKLGLMVPPSAKGAGHFERGIESIGGKADIAREMSARNREAIQVSARKEAGIPADQPITEATLEAARDRLATPYKQISALSNKAAQALERLKEARLDSKDLWSKYGREPDPTTRKLALKADDRIEKLEGVISKEAGDLAPDLLPALKQARVQIAKNYDVEKTLNLGTGEIDARQLGRMLDKRGTKAMTGDLQTIGKFAQAYPDFVQPKAVATDVSMLRPYASLLGLSVGAGAGGEYLGQKYGGTNYGYVMAALPFLSPAARSIALSKLMQQGSLEAGGASQRLIQSGMVPLSNLTKEQ